MEVLYLDCGARRSQLMRDPLGSVMGLSRSTVFRIVVLVPLFLASLVLGLLTLFGDVPWINDTLGDLGLYLAIVWPVIVVPCLWFAAAFLLRRRRREDSHRGQSGPPRSPPDAA